jgi:hypothetical protein
LLNVFEVAEAVGKVPGTYSIFTESTDMARKAYFVRTPARSSGTGASITYTPASRAARVRTANPTKDITLRERNGAVQLRKNWSYRLIKNSVADAAVDLTTSFNANLDTFNSIEVWTTPGRRPASKVAVNSNGTFTET